MAEIDYSVTRETFHDDTITPNDNIHTSIVSRTDRLKALDLIADKLGCPAESVGKLYAVNTKTVTVGNKEYHLANGLYLWVNRSGSLREMMENEMVFFPRYARYLVLNDVKDDNTILLYNTRVKLNKELKYRLLVEAELSVNVPDMSEAMRFINNDIVGKMFEKELDYIFM